MCCKRASLLPAEMLDPEEENRRGERKKSCSQGSLHTHTHKNVGKCCAGYDSVEETPRLEHVRHNHIRLEQIPLQQSREEDGGGFSGFGG